uniref:Uncharacterized protein n=1 Tax=Arundo donax TaxID=35708 RepID=A0A0A9F8X5_ARUDO
MKMHLLVVLVTDHPVSLIWKSKSEVQKDIQR